MATRKITVTTERLTGAADKIENSAGEYQRTYNKLYTEVENMRAAWDGADNTAYVSQISGFKDDFQLMYQLMTEYAQFLRMSAKQYEGIQSEIIQAAQSLVN